MPGGWSSCGLNIGRSGFHATDVGFHPLAFGDRLMFQGSDPAQSGRTRTVNGTVRLKDQSRNGTARQMQPGQSALLNGTADEITVATVGSVQHISMRIKFAATNQEILALQDSTATAVTVVAGVLTFGGSLSASNIYVDGVSKTAAQAGALLNDLAWHRLDFDLAAISASSLVVGQDGGTGFGNFYLHDLRMDSAAWSAGQVATVAALTIGVSDVGSTGTELLWWKLEEDVDGTYTTAIDSSGNGKDGTFVVAAIGTTRDKTVNDQYSFLNEVGYTDDTGVSGAYLPRDESATTLDTGGGALEFTGQAPHDAPISSPCLTLDGTADVLVFGSTGVSTTEIKLWVKQVADNQEILTLQNATTHAITVVTGTLTYGPSLTVSATDIDGTDYTSDLASAGALLNDNDWHELTVTLSAVTASDFRIGTDGTGFGNISVANIRLNTTALVAMCDEGAGRICHDSSGNNNHGVATLAAEATAWANKQDKVDLLVAKGASAATRYSGTGEYYKHSGRLTSGTLTQLSIAAWVNAQVSPTNLAVAGEYLSTGNQRGWLLWFWPGNTLLFTASQTGISGVTTSHLYTPTVVNKWVHVGARFDGGLVSLFVDGAKVVTDNPTGLSSIFNGTSHFSLAAYQTSTAPTGLWNGMLADVVVEAAAWVDSDFTSLFAGSAPVGAWRFPYGDGTETQQGLAALTKTGTPDRVNVPQGILPTTYGPGVLFPNQSLDFGGGEANSPYAQQLADILADLTYDQAEDDALDAQFARVNDYGDDRIFTTVPALTGDELTNMQNYTS